MRPSAVPLPVALAVAASLLTALAPGAPATAAPIATDRPTVAASPYVVGPRVVQVEFGLQVERTGGGRDLTVLATPTLVRAGLSDRLEFRASGDLWTRVDDPASRGTTTRSGLAPVDLGGKLTIRRGTAGGPGLGLLIDVGIPSGVRSFRRDRTEVTARALADVALRPGLALGLDAGARIRKDAADDRKTVGLGAAVVSAALGDTVGGFLELAVEGPDPATDDTGVVLDLGVTWRLSDELQLDAAIGFGLDDGVSPDAFGGIGISAR